MYDGYMREFCPHALGVKTGEEHCLAYQFGGHSSRGPIVRGSSPKNWRCFVVAGLSGVSLRDGEWHSCDTRGGPSQCLDPADVRGRDPVTFLGGLVVLGHACLKVARYSKRIFPAVVYIRLHSSEYFGVC